MAIIRWEPFREMVTLREKMNRLFEDAVVGQREEKDLVSSTWSPSVDIFETENEIVLTAELPGIEDKGRREHLSGFRQRVGLRPDVEHDQGVGVHITEAETQ